MFSLYILAENNFILNIRNLRILYLHFNFIFTSQCDERNEVPPRIRAPLGNNALIKAAATP